MSIKPREPSAAVAKRFGRLFEILQYRRPNQAKSEEKCINQFLRCRKHKEYKGGIIIEVKPKVPAGQLQWLSETMFSCHTDTVHHTGGTQNILVDEELGIVYKDDKSPLGADDGAGWWLMLEMIDAGVPGTYVFHRGEEVGGIGSSWFAANQAEDFKRFKRAVAFDRRATDSIITWQRGGTCCSDEFATALAAALNAVNETFDYKPDSTGVFTDTANYTHLVPECTNVSVGYEHEHTGEETLDLIHLIKLRDALIRIDWEALPTIRMPEKRFVWSGFSSRGTRYTPPKTPPVPTVTDVFLMDKDELEEWVYTDPQEAADLLWSLVHSGEQEVAEDESAAADVIELGGEKYLDDGHGNLVKLRGEPAALLTTPARGTPDDPWDDDVYGYPRGI